jgi:hypothetical protein
MEAVLGPLYLRLLVTREELDDAFAEAIVDIVVSGQHGGSPASLAGR